MKWLVCSVWVLGLCFGGYAEGEYRLFTDQEGRIINAKVIQFDPRSEKVTVERDNRRRVTVPVRIFSAADQEYIQEWFSAQAFLSNSKLRVKVEKEKGKTVGKSQTKRSKPPCHYEISLDNRSGSPLEGIRVEYCMYVVTDFSGGKDDVVKVEHGSFDTFSLGNRAQKSMETKTVKLYRYYSEQLDTTYDSYGGFDTSISYNKTKEEGLEGIRVRIYLKTKKGSEFMREICEPDSVEGKYGWNPPAATSSNRKKRR